MQRYGRAARVDRRSQHGRKRAPITPATAGIAWRAARQRAAFGYFGVMR